MVHFVTYVPLTTEETGCGIYGMVYMVFFIFYKQKDTVLPRYTVCCVVFMVADGTLRDWCRIFKEGHLMCSMRRENDDS